MRAVVITKHGPPEVLQVQERPDPQARDGKVLIDVKAAGINFADTMARVGLYPDAPKPPCVVGTLVGRRERPHLLEAWGQRFNLQMEDHIVLFRHSDVPGMIGRVGTIFGDRGINIGQMVVGRPPSHDDGQAVMVLTTDAPVPRDVVDEIVAIDGFVEGRAVSL